ncbi:MAG: YgjP-like metallopeptidase domain-containing protein, partial [Chloroflexota bacterium]
AKALKAEGVDTIFTLCGGHIIDIYDGFIEEGLRKLGDDVPPMPEDKTDRATIKAMVKDYAQRMEVKATRVQFRDMRRKWGSCSSKGTVTLNSRLTWLDAELAEYIVCHELAHLKELNHSKKFWHVVETYMPDYDARRKRLREIEKTLHW